LLIQLEELSEEARTARITELKGMDARQLESENAAARNRNMLNILGLGDAQKETLWGSGTAPPPKPKPKAKPKARMALGKRARKGGKRPAEDDDESSGSESESEGEGGPPAKKQAPSQKAAKTAVAASGGRTVKAASKWAETARTFLTSKVYGGNWLVLVGLWWSREEDAGFQGSVST
jgi:hypothetical protein